MERALVERLSVLPLSAPSDRRSPRGEEPSLRSSSNCWDSLFMELSSAFLQLPPVVLALSAEENNFSLFPAA